MNTRTTIFKKALSRLALFSALIAVSVVGNTASAHEGTYYRSGISTINQMQSPQAPNSAVTASLSRNWSGYAATGNTYTGVSGSWTVPNASSSLPVAADATWVGIGGLSSSDLIQVGTQAIIENGTPQYQAWYELLPNASTPVSLSVNPGDSITATINQSGTNEWFIDITDNTTGQSYSTTVNYTSSENSAEWIEEMPTDQSGYVPLDNFGTVSFTNANTTVNGQIENLAQAGAHALAMTNESTLIAEPSAIGNDGASFTVSRTNESSGVTSEVLPNRRGAWRVGRGDQGQTSGSFPFASGTPTTIQVSIPNLSNIIPNIISQIPSSYGVTVNSSGSSSQPTTRTVYVPGVGEVTETSQSFTSGDGSMNGFSYSFSF